MTNWLRKWFPLVIAKMHKKPLVSVVMEYLNQHKKTKQPLFEQLRLISDFSDDEIDLLFQRDSDTGREIELWAI